MQSPLSEFHTFHPQKNFWCHLLHRHEIERPSLLPNRTDSMFQIHCSDLSARRTTVVSQPRLHPLVSYYSSASSSLDLQSPLLPFLRSLARALDRARFRSQSRSGSKARNRSLEIAQAYAERIGDSSTTPHAECCYTVAFDTGQ